MADENRWTEAVRMLSEQTEKGEVSWQQGLFPPDIRPYVTVSGDGIYSTVINGRKLIVYEYTYQNWIDSGNSTDETEVAIEFVDGEGKLQYQWPKLPFRLQLLDAIRYRVSGAYQFLDSFVPQPRKNERASYIGSWEVGVSTSIETFLAVLNPDGTAQRTMRGARVSGKWDFKDQGAYIEWADGWRDEIKPAPHGFFKKSFHNGQFREVSTARQIRS
jgi:hypothetical protein